MSFRVPAGVVKSGGRVPAWANAAVRGSFISIALEQGEIWLLMVYVKAKFDNLPASFLKQLREAIEHG